eukprot:2785029-Pleurochrysis_carterae.AAC.8
MMPNYNCPDGASGYEQVYQPDLSFSYKNPAAPRCQIQIFETGCCEFVEPARIPPQACISG